MPSDPETLRKILSTNIKSQRKLLGISQEKLAEMTGLSAQTVNDIEGRRMWVSDKTITKLANVFHVEAFELLIPPPGQGNDEAAAQEKMLLFQIQKNLKEYINLQIKELMG
jgi:transcriptional regulator with XRE-family HTH domain